jgi:hypothetical protein
VTADAVPRRRRARWSADAWAAAGVGLGAVILVLCHLMIPNPIGMADTGDGRRLLCQIDAGDPHFAEARNSAERFVAITYVKIPDNPTACGRFRVTERYPSSAVFVLAGAQRLTWLVGLPGALDMRVTGVLYSLLYGLVIGLLVRVLPGPRWARVLAAAAVGLIGADATFALYFISPFSEPLEFVALLGSYAGLLALWRRRVVPGWVLVGVLVIFAVLVTSKSQEIALSVLLGAALLTARSTLRRRTSPPELPAAAPPSGADTAPGLRHRLATARAGRLLPAAAAVVLVVVGAVTLYLQPRLFNVQLRYTDVFYTILADSPDVPGDLKELGLPQGLSRYVGKTWFEVRPQLSADPEYQYFVRHNTFGQIALFYARHPQRLGKVTATGIQDVVKARHPLPNTTRTEAATPQVVCRWCLVPPVGAALKPAAVVLWPAWELAVLVVGGALAWRRRHDRSWRALGFVLVLSVALAVFHLFTAILGDGYAELGKHVFPAVVDTWLTIPLVLLGAAGLFGRRPRGPRAVARSGAAVSPDRDGSVRPDPDADPDPDAAARGAAA